MFTDDPGKGSASIDRNNAIPKSGTEFFNFFSDKKKNSVKSLVVLPEPLTGKGEDSSLGMEIPESSKRLYRYPI